MFYIVAIVLFPNSLILLWLAVKSRNGIPLNHLVGIRTRKTMASEEIFQISNRAVWKGHLYSAVLVAAHAIFCAVGNLLNLNPYLLVGTIIVGMILVIIIILFQTKIANKVASILLKTDII